LTRRRGGETIEHRLLRQPRHAPATRRSEGETRHRQTNGTVGGTATVHDVSAGVTAKIGVNCLKVVGNAATISGIVTSSSDPTLVGRRVDR
jgi:hypothetical protein